MTTASQHQDFAEASRAGRHGNGLLIAVGFLALAVACLFAVLSASDLQAGLRSASGIVVGFLAGAAFTGCRRGAAQAA